MIYTFTADPAGWDGSLHDLAYRILEDGLSGLGWIGSDPGYGTDPYGKPFFTGEGMPEFNISHCRTLVAAAAAPCGIPVGIDAERRFSPGTALLAEICSKEELEILQSAPLGRRDSLAGLLWSRKESWLKWKGTGLRIRLSSFSVLAKDEESAAGPGGGWIPVKRTVRGEKVLFFEQQGADHTLCLCCEDSPGIDAAPPRMCVPGQGETRI